MVATLPKYMVCKSRDNNKYLSYVKEDVQIHGFLKFSGEEVLSPYAKFRVEMAKGGNGLVHIRCCYNNKYWVRWQDHHYWIVAGANEPQEDLSKWTCTLFEPVYFDDGDHAKGVQFRHVQLGYYACCLPTASPLQEPCLFAGSLVPHQDLCDAYLIVDWETLVALPKHVAFKGDNGKYLCNNQDSFLQFLSNNIRESSVGNEVFSNGDGSVRIKCNRSGKFWTGGRGWILVNSNLDGNENNKDMLFTPIKVDGKVVLRNLGNNKFCVRSNTGGFFNCLNASETDITQEAHMELEEPILSRSIYNVNFRRLDARIYSQRVVTMATGDAINRTKEENRIDFKLKYKVTRSQTWNASISGKLGLKTTFETGIPFIAKGQIEISAELGGEYQWGKTDTSENEEETVYHVVVPSMSMVKVSLTATTASCDVPFSYTQRDILTNGEHVTQTMDDGVYSGFNSYNFKYEAKQESLC